MVRMDKKEQIFLEALAVGLLRADEIRGIPRSQIARRCGIRQNLINKWLDQGQGMRPISIEKILRGYGIEPVSLFAMVEGFSSKPQLFNFLAKIAKSQKEELKEKIVSEAEFLAGQTED
jgi:hypothetical protein